MMDRIRRIWQRSRSAGQSMGSNLASPPEEGFAGQATDVPEPSHSQLKLVEGDHWNHLCSRCRNLRVYESTSERNPNSNIVISGLQLESGLQSRCTLCKMMMNHIRSRSSGAVLYGRIKYPDSGTHIGWLEAFQSTHGDFVLSTEYDDPAASVLSRRPPLTTYDSEGAYTQIRQWMSECFYSGSHHECKAPASAPLPRRVIDVGTINQDPFLVIPKPGAMGPYVALSYCWGLSQPVTLTAAKLRMGLITRLVKFPLQQLPQTLRDAIVICRRLGFKYIWIDALCIIQDSPNSEDWMIESSMMNEVYGNATLTIAASGATEASQGIFSFPFNPEEETCTIPYRLLDGRVGKAFVRFYPHKGKKVEALARRAWALQESLMSPYVLSYHTDQLVWQCHTTRIFADGPVTVDQPQLARKWENVIAHYTQCGMTFPSDKLAAISGYAKSRSDTDKSDSFRYAEGGNSYLAGLWLSHLPSQLLWCADQSAVQPRPAFRAPTWSWASIDSPIQYKLSTTAIYTFQVLDYSIAASKLDPFGPIDAYPPSYIRIKACVKSASGIRIRLTGMQTEICMEERLHSNYFTVNFDTIEDRSTLLSYTRPCKNGNETFLYEFSPLSFLPITICQALLIAPVVKGGLEHEINVFQRLGVVIDSHQTNFSNKFKDAAETTIILV
ncbi:heterokaryon incompatibility protein-domain-containing protein [Bisporella sp. PMI_857]|nr:heterokaryon incompatibility protein-domain-containing protein [Bisporella sp. PMI_857]